MRKLAEQSNQFADEINSTIHALTNVTSQAIEPMAELEDVVESQDTSVDMTSNKFDGIAESIEAMQKV